MVIIKCVRKTTVDCLRYKLGNAHMASLVFNHLKNRNKYTEHKMCASFLFTAFVWNVFCSNKFLTSYTWDNPERYVYLYVNSPLFLSNFNQNWNLFTYFIMIPNMKFHENMPNGSTVTTCVQAVGWRERT
jgi:hypothetical protein